MNTPVHVSLPFDRHIQLLADERLAAGAAVHEGDGDLPRESCVVYVPPHEEMYERWSRWRGLSARLRRLVGDPSVSPPFVRLLSALGRARRRCPGARYVVVFGKTDQEWTPIHERLLPDNVIAVFANNVGFASERSVPYPMGRDWRLARETYRATPPAQPLIPAAKSTACYANFGVDTHAGRDRIAALCQRNPTIDTGDLGGRHLAYPISYARFFERLAASVFCICPRGSGLDTYRFWDCLYLDVVPVIFDSSPYRGLPDRPPFLEIAPEALPSIDFEQLADDQRRRPRPWPGRETALDIEFWRTMMSETVRHGRLPSVAEVVGRMPPVPVPAGRTVVP